MKSIRKRISSRMLLGLLIFVGVMIFVGVLMRGKLNSLLRAHIENVVAAQAELMADIFEDFLKWLKSYKKKVPMIPLF